MSGVGGESPGQGRDDRARPELLVRIGIDGLILFLPQREVQTVEPVMDVDRSYPPPGAVGEIGLDEQVWPVYGLDGRLQPTTAVPPARRACALLAVGDACFGVLCDAFRSLPASELELHPLPSCLATAETPVRALAVHGQDIGCVVSAAALRSLAERACPPVPREAS